jgi:hypothetical protein
MGRARAGVESESVSHLSTADIGSRVHAKKACHGMRSADMTCGAELWDKISRQDAEIAKKKHAKKAATAMITAVSGRDSSALKPQIEKAKESPYGTMTGLRESA